MAHFLGSVCGSRGEASRLGSKASGLFVTAASWQGAVRVDLSERDGVDHARVSLMPWHGVGVSRVLYDGPVGGTPLDPRNDKIALLAKYVSGDDVRCESNLEFLRMVRDRIDDDIRSQEGIIKAWKPGTATKPSTLIRD